MIYALIFGILGAFILGGAGGYFLGLYQARLLDKIRTLREEPEIEEKPTVTYGTLERPLGISNVPDDNPVGIIEAKTPQLIEFEADQKTERIGRGIEKP